MAGTTTGGRMRTLLKEFREFAMRGNIVELAVAFVMGVAFTAVVQSLVNDVVLNLVAAIFGRPNFSELVFTLNGARIGYGAFITAVVNLVIIALALFLILKAIDAAKRLREQGAEQPAATRPCPFCYTGIPAQATRCPACTSTVEPAAVSTPPQ